MNNKYMKWALGIVLTPFLLIVLLAIALYIPPIQNWAVDTVASYASKEMGMDVTVEHVRLVFPLDLGIDGVKVIQPNDSLPQRKDTIADLKRAVVDVQLMPLFDSKVNIDRLDIYDLKMNTANLVHEARVKGRVGELSLAPPHALPREGDGSRKATIDLGKEFVDLGKVYLADAHIDVALSDTVPEDTTKSEVFWKINAEELAIENSDATIHMPGDTLQVKAVLGKVSAKKGFFDLYKGEYNIASLDWQNGAIYYDNNFEPRLKGLDVNHIALTNIGVGIDTLHFLAAKDSVNAMEMRLGIRQCQMMEKCGIGVKSLTGSLVMDSLKVITDFDLALNRDVNADIATSTLKANAIVDLNVMDSINPGKVYVDADASIGSEDILLGMGMGDMPKAFMAQWPRKPLAIKLSANGNMNRVDIKSAYAQLPGAFNVKADGYAEKFMDVNKLVSDLHLDAQTYNLDFVKTMLDKSTAKMIGLPAMHAVADAKIRGQVYDVDFRATEGKGSVSGKANFNAKAMAYKAQLKVDALQLGHFVKGMGLGGFTGNADIDGVGTDVFSPRTKINAKAQVIDFAYSKWNLNKMNFDAELSGGRAQANIISKNPLLDGKIGLDALLSKNVDATITTELNKADLYHLYIAEKPLTVAGCAHLDVATDMDEYYKLVGTISDLTIIDSLQTYRPDDMVIDLVTRTDTTHAVADCGDFHLKADLSGGYKKLMKVSDNLMNEIQRQWDARIISEKDLRGKLPEGKVYLSLGRENPVARTMKRFDLGIKDVLADFTVSPVAGINGEIAIDTLQTASLQLDRIRAVITSDAQQMRYTLDVENGKNNPQYVFSAQAKGALLPNGTSVGVIIDDARKKRIVDVGALAVMEARGIRLSLDDRKHTLGYKPFSVNADNYVLLAPNMRVSANMKLKTSDGMGLQIYTDDDNIEALQDITLSLHRFDLAEIVSVIPYMPKMGGIMDGDFHVIQTEKDLSVSSSIGFKDLMYENCGMGNISSEFVYMPMEDGTHHIDGILMKDDIEVASVIGGYNPDAYANEGGALNLDVNMQKLPLNIANGFVPDQIMGLEGTGEGQLTIHGSVSKPVVNGDIFLQDASLISVPYGISLKFDDDPVRITDSKLLFENFQMYANNEQPLVLRGDIDFSDLDHINMNLRMRAKDYLLIDAKETRRSEAYGKGYVDFFGRITGELSDLKVRGNLTVLSKSNLYYILRDSPITTDNRLKELVTFTDLSGEDPLVVNRPEVDGMSVDLSVTVQEGAHVTCWLNTNHTNYLDIFGSGSLRMKYLGGDINMNGRYTISNGEMKYSLPVIPLKTFKISEGSYIEFTGDMMNPRLNITAVEENKTTVNLNDTETTVLFECGVVLSKTLQDMGLEFIIDAPENSAVSDELKAKTLEERGKLAVTMLTTGMYLTENNTSSFTMNSALSSFLQQEINKIAGSALRTLDLSVGLENNKDETGKMHTDYTFKFAKRFWNNRFSVAVGGRISTGSEASGQSNTFFDNVELQYRTSDTSNQYLQMSYKANVYDFLEGYVDQYSAGYMWKRKLQNFRDIFQFGDKNLSAIRRNGQGFGNGPTTRRDSVNTATSTTPAPEGGTEKPRTREPEDSKKR